MKLAVFFIAGFASEASTVARIAEKTRIAVGLDAVIPAIEHLVLDQVD